jgi:hypothetical protein
MRRYLPAALVVLSFAGVPGVAGAATWKVTTRHDGAGSCTGHACTTLRSAVSAAAGGDTVKLPARPSHYLLNHEVRVTKPLTIQGASARSSVVDAAGHSRAFEITSGVSDTETVSFRDLTITGGKVTTLTQAAPGGAGIAVDQNAGDLVLFRGHRPDPSGLVHGSELTHTQTPEHRPARSIPAGRQGKAVRYRRLREPVAARGARPLTLTHRLEPPFRSFSAAFGE